MIRFATAATILATLSVAAHSQDIQVTEGEYASPKPNYSPYVDEHFPQNVYFGDTHLHTSFSMDAGAFGARIGPRDAYRFARGEQVVSSTGQPVRLSRPLDWLVVSDHSTAWG